MASIEAAEADEETPLEFSTQEEENAYFDRVAEFRSQEASERRLNMMGGFGVQGPQEHCAFFKLNADVDDCASKFAKRAGSVLSTIQSGIAGASFRPLTSSRQEFDWVFKIQFKNTADVANYYGLIEDAVSGAAEELVTDSLMVDSSGLNFILTTRTRAR